MIEPIYDNILDTLPMGICIVDRTYRVLFWNATLAAWTGYRNADVEGHLLSDLYEWINEPRYRMRIEGLFDGGPPVLLSSQIHRSLFTPRMDDHRDQVQQVTVTAARRTDGEGFNAVFSVKDVSSLDSQIHKYRDLKDKALEEIVLREKVEAELRRLNRTLEEVNRTDGLTGLMNRRGLLEQLEREILRSRRSGRTLCLVYSDLDDFRAFNNRYGHDCGDYVLERVGAFFTESLRATDVPSRWGGEEFVTLLPETDLDEGMTVARKLCTGLASESLHYEEQDLQVTMTFGIAEYDEANDSVETLLKRADEALYRGKRDGKNRVVPAREPRALAAAAMIALTMLW